MKLLGIGSVLFGSVIVWITRKGVQLSDGRVIPLNEVVELYL